MAGNKRFGKHIRQLREEKRRSNPAFSLRKFAEAVEISATYLSKIETGEFDPPGPERIKKMAELLSVDADELLALAGQVAPVLKEIIREQSKAMADFLRTAAEKGLTAKQIEKLTDHILRGKQP